MKSRQSTSASLFARLLKGEDPAVLAKSLLREVGEPESFHRPISYPKLGLAWPSELLRPGQGSSGVRHLCAIHHICPPRESVHRRVLSFCWGVSPMTLADVYEHNAKECREAAERTDNAVHRVRLLKAAREWWQDAEALRVRLRRVDRLP